MCYAVGMKEFDGRKLDHKTRETIRIRAIKRIEAGESPEVIAKTLGYHRSCIYDWIARYREGGIEALRAKPIPGAKPKLNGKQLQWIHKTIVGKNPLQLKLPFALWTRAMVRELIMREFDVKLSEVSVGRLLKKLGFTAQKPLHRAYQQNPQLVLNWQARELPRIRAMAKAEKATIYYADESTIRSDYHSGTTWAPKGQTPVIRSTGSIFKVNMISAISPRGALRFMMFDGRMNADVFCDFLKRLLYKADKPVYVIVDNHPVHRSYKVRDFVESTEGKLKMFFLPPYSPELNPDELVWANMKKKMGKQVSSNLTDLKKRIISFVRSLNMLPDKVAAFFKHPSIKFAWYVSGSQQPS